MPYTFVFSSCTCRLSRFVYTYDALPAETARSVKETVETWMPQATQET